MIFFITKIVVSAIIIAVISEISKRSSIWAATLASLPLVSILSIVWIYLESKDTDRIAKLSTDILWLVIPSLLFFVAFPFMLHKGVTFWLALAVASFVTMAGYALTLKLIS